MLYCNKQSMKPLIPIRCRAPESIHLPSNGRSDNTKGGTGQRSTDFNGDTLPNNGGLIMKKSGQGTVNRPSRVRPYK